MASSQPVEILLGCDPQVRVVVIEDASSGNLVLQVFAEDPAATDIDALFFNLTDDTIAPDLRIFYTPDDGVTTFDVAGFPRSQLTNGAQVQDQYDVQVEFGTDTFTTAGDVDQSAFTLWVDGGGATLTADSIDLSNLTAVVNSDGGNGLALVGGIGRVGTVEEITIQSADFEGIHDASDSDAVVYNEGWAVENGELRADGHNEGNIYFEEVAVEGDAQISFDARVPNADRFENSGHYQDSLEVWALVDGTEWVLLDTFQVNDAGTALVGDTTGQTITADSSTLTYSGGALDGANTVQLVLDADISAGNEEIYVDNLEITDTVTTGGETVEVQNEVLADDFFNIHNASDAQSVEWAGHWQAGNGELETNGHADGCIWFENTSVDGPAEISFDARAPHTEYFENGGCYGDSLEVWALIDNNSWELLDTFVVNDAGTALVGNTTGQAFGADSTTLNYSGGALDDANSVQLVLRSDISAGNEEIFIDNLSVTETVEVDAHQVCEDFDDGASGDTVAMQFDGFSVTGQRAGDAADSENDAMLFDTANPTGGDNDLHYVNQGNAIIISEDNDASDADDNAHGGTLTFEFDEVSSVDSLTILDVEETGGSIDLFDVDGGLINSVAIPAGTDNGIQDLDIGVDGVSTMVVNLAGSGAVDDLCFTPESSLVECLQYEVTYDDEFTKLPEELDDDVMDGLMM